MSKTTIRHFEAEDILHIAIAEGPESRSIKLSPMITVELNDNDEMIGVEILEASSFLRDAVLESIQARMLQEHRADLFALLRDAAAQNAACNQLSEEEAIQLVEEARQEIAEES